MKSRIEATFVGVVCKCIIEISRSNSIIFQQFLPELCTLYFEFAKFLVSGW